MEDIISDCVRNSRDTILDISGELVLVKDKLRYFKDLLIQCEDENYKELRNNLAVDIVYAMKYVDNCLNTVLNSQEIK